jgi:hypothetical protein
MDAALYFELVDAVAGVDGQVELAAVTKRVVATPMHPFERRVLERALRARTESLALQSQLFMTELLRNPVLDAKPLAAGG